MKISAVEATDNLLSGVNEILSVLSLLLYNFSEIFYKESTHNVVDLLWVH